MQIEQYRKAASDRIFQFYTDADQRNMALGLFFTQQEIDTAKAFISEVRAKYQSLKPSCNEILGFQDEADAEFANLNP